MTSQRRTFAAAFARGAFRVPLTLTLALTLTLSAARSLAAQTQAPPAPGPVPPRADAATFDPLGARIDPHVAKPRLIVLTDIANEPDDQMSLVRLLVYSNQFDIEGLVATTSRHLRKGPRPDVIRTVLGAYAKVQPNLLKHEPGFPEAAVLSNLVVAGQDGYGMESVGPGKTTEGAELIVKAAVSSDPRPLWVTVWGGANTLAQALWYARSTRPAADVERIVSKLRVYTISDQDDAGPWLRREFPMLHYIATPGDHVDYHVATWTGLAGDEFYRNAPGADWTTVSEAWLNEHVRNKGPLGAYYPLPCCMIEGDTPSFLSLIDNGLAAYMNPSFGGWGGRYVWRQPWLETRPYWTNSRASRDTVTGVDGKPYTSDQATIWRWRTAYMHDFAARMAWTVSGVAEANHNPDVVVNGVKGKAPLAIDAKAGTPITLDAAGSSDRDRHALRYQWFFYPEAGTGIPSSSGGGTPAAPTAPPAPTTHPAPAAGATGDASAQGSASSTSKPGGPALVSAIAPQPAGGRPTPKPRVTVTNGETSSVATVMPNTPGIAHVILAVTDDGTPSLTSYRRIILTIQP
jgi:hypothetical protein